MGDALSVEADYIYVGGRDERSNQGAQRNNVNLTYDPATGVNYPYTDISRHPFPDWGPIYMNLMGGRSNSHGLQTAFTKRLSNRWQASGTYTLSWLYDVSAPAFSGVRPVPFAVQPDLGGDYSYSASDQRHRATLNGIWQVGGGLQLTLDGILEAYNLFNHENFGNYEVRDSNANYGKPVPLLSLVYQPRMLQLGFRATF